MSDRWITRRLLIVVKTYPNPSARVNEAVCTAGVDENGRFVRLFPIPLRHMEDRFKKWQWIEARITKSKTDSRAESYKVDPSSIKSLEFIAPEGDGWKRRWGLVEHLVSPSLESVKESGATLGLIKPKSFDLTFAPQKSNWTDDELQKLYGQAELGGILTPAGGRPRKPLEKMDMRFYYRYRCAGDDCVTRHEQTFEDWEACESWRSWKARYRTSDVRKAAMIKTYVERPRLHDNLYLFVGNTASRRTAWLVIGHAMPMRLEVNDRGSDRSGQAVRDRGSMTLPGITFEAHQGDLPA